MINTSISKFNYLKKWQKGLLVTGVTLVLITILLSLLILIALARFNRAHKNDEYKLGATFSASYARYLEVDSKAAYLGLLDDLNIRQLRLVSYWSEGEPQEGHYNFEELDWQLSQAQRVGAKVSLAVGLRQPRYPECHVPKWALDLPDKQQMAGVRRYLQVVVERYRNHPAVASWQLENEALNKVFGLCQNYDRSRLVDEFNLVKRLDPNHPVIMNLSNETGYPLGQPRGDIFGFSIYRIVYERLVLKRYVTYIFTPTFHRIRAALIEQYLHRPVIIHELQAEPWGPTDLPRMSLADQDKSMNAVKLTTTVEYAKATGIRYMDLWGAEWWYWRKMHGDPTVWESARAIYAASPHPR